MDTDYTDGHGLYFNIFGSVISEIRVRRTNMKKMITMFAIIAIFMIALYSSAFAGLNITLEWDASTSPDIAGYKVYYKTGTSGPPYSGTGAVEGNSPIDVGNILTFTITGLAEDEDYYFVATAYDDRGRESDYSNEVSTVRPAPPQNLIIALIQKILAFFMGLFGNLRVA